MTKRAGEAYLDQSFKYETAGILDSFESKFIQFYISILNGELKNSVMRVNLFKITQCQESGHQACSERGDGVQILKT